MKVNLAVLHGFSKEKYLDYIHSLPNFKEEKVQSYATLILTLFAICIFGIFAIAPTLGTIFQLRKTLTDNKFVDGQLQTKISNMSSLQQSYSQLSGQLPLIYAAVPKTASESDLGGKIRALGASTKVNIKQLSITSVVVTSNKHTASTLTPVPIIISLQGDLDNLKTFTTRLVNLDRIVTITGLNYSTLKTQDGVINQLSIQAQAYYRP